ncbi:hypothetical protein BJV74DRAFT_800177 [Russula compacta]|nr:hypothetical protein BJV74DRAFT_800177 [Russula compacta]
MPPQTWTMNSKHLAYELSIVTLKRKYHMKAEIQAEKKAGEEKKVQAEEVKKVKIQQVARLEERIAEKDLIDVTPQPLYPHPQHQMGPTESCVDTVASLSSDEGVEEQTDQISDLDFAQPIDTEGTMESKDEPKDAAPEKKAKLSEQQICIAIEDACKELASGRGKAMVDDKKSDGCHCKTTAVVLHGDENNNPMLDKVWIKLWASGLSSMASKWPSLTLTNGYRQSSTMMTSMKPKLTANHEHACESQGVPIGGFSNGKELDGPEHEIAINNPPKGNKHLASSDVIRVEDIYPDWIIEESKKAKSRVTNDNLPAGTHDEDQF